MTKLPAFLITLLAILLISANAKAASLHPLALTSSPLDTSDISNNNTQLQLSVTLGLRPVTPAPAIPTLPPAPKLTLSPKHFTPNDDFVVGKNSLVLVQYSRRNWQLRPNFEMRDQWNFLRRQTLGPDNLERLANMFDIDEQERPWSTTTTVHLLAPTKDPFVPFATIAHEIDADEDLERFGIGAGAMIILGKNINIGAEIIRYSGDRSQSNGAFSSDTQFLTRLQIDF